MDQLLFGWPGIIASLVIGAAGVAGKKPWLLVLGGLVALPHAIYLSGSPSIQWAAYLLPLAYLDAAVTLRYKPRWLAGLWLLPQLATDTWLAVAVLNQPR
jgi:hypothetical protein